MEATIFEPFVGDEKSLKGANGENWISTIPCVLYFLSQIRPTNFASLRFGESKSFPKKSLLADSLKNSVNSLKTADDTQADGFRSTAMILCQWIWFRTSFGNFVFSIELYARELAKL